MQSARKFKVMVVGLDSATLDILKPWMDSGLLPNLARLSRNGVALELESTIPPHTGAAWSSLITGVNPGKHGIYTLMEYLPGKGILPTDSTRRRSRAVWDILGLHGKKVIVVSVPITYPVEPVNGVMISGFMTPRNAGDYIYPRSLMDELKRVQGGFLIDGAEKRSALRGEYETVLIEGQNNVLQNHISSTLYLMENYPWDFMMLVIHGTDVIQHKFFELLDKRHPLFDEKRSRKHAAAILQYYQKVDEGLGKIIEKADDNTVILVPSDHGAGPLYRMVSINNLLLRMGLLKFKRGVKVQLKYLLFRMGATPLNLFRLALKLKLGGIRGQLRREGVRRKVRRFFLSLADVDWKRTRAYALGGWGQVFINMKSRGSDGVVEPGEESNVLVDMISEELARIRDPRNGQTVFEKSNVFRKEQIYAGPHANSAPEITAIAAPGYKAYPDYEFGFNSIVTDTFPGMGGTHTMNGMLVMSGPAIERNESVGKAKIVDVAPTILYLLDVPIPEDIDGRVLTEFLKPSLTRSRPARYQGALGTRGEATHAYSEEEQEQLKKLLKELGYL